MNASRGREDFIEQGLFKGGIKQKLLTSFRHLNIVGLKWGSQAPPGPPPPNLARPL